MRGTYSKHGHDYSSPTYRSWKNMKVRCTWPGHTQWKDYGGRGITVCERWMKFDNFLADMGERPEGLTLDRKDNDGNYEPGNCRWATREEQGRNRSDNRFVFVDGESLTLTDACKKFDMHFDCIRARLDKGWDAKTALTTPSGMG